VITRTAFKGKLTVRYLGGSPGAEASSFSKTVEGGLVLRKPMPSVRRVLDLVGIEGHRGIRIDD
jgi:hypothetical protein